MKLSDLITYYILQFFKKYFSIISAQKRYKVSTKIASLLYSHTSLRKNQARNNIKLAFPMLNNVQIEDLLKKSYQFFCHNFIEFITFPKSWEGLEIEIKGKRILQSMLKENKGIVFITGHFGAWEILGKWVGQNVPLFVGVAHKQKNKGAHKFAINQRELPGTKHIFRREPLQKMYDVLSKNGLLGLVSDQDAKKKGIFVDFFGVQASTPKGAALFHINTSAPILLGVCIKINFRKYIIHFNAIDTSSKKIKTITQVYTSQLEEYIKQYPYQYFWFHRRWKTKNN